MPHTDDAAPIDSVTPRTCPHCGWHQPPGARLCAACGIVFEKYAVAERRRRARAMTAALAPVPVEADVGVDDVDAGAEAPPPRAVDVVGAAARGAVAATVPLVALQMLPFVVAVALGASAAVITPSLLALGTRTGPVPLVIVGAFALLVVVRLAGAIVAGSLVAVDDAMEGVERGVLDTLGEGWVRGGRALGVQLVLVVVAVVALAPFVALSWVGASSFALMATAAFTAVAALVLMVRLSLALPLAVLGQRDVIDAIQESWHVTDRARGVVVTSLLLGGLLALAGAVCGSMIAVIPVLGWAAAIVIQAVVQGFGVGVTARLFRQLAR